MRGSVRVIYAHGDAGTGVLLRAGKASPMAHFAATYFSNEPWLNVFVGDS